MEALQTASAYIFSPQGALLVAIGTILGITMGAIPGLTGAMLIALTLPLTFNMDPICLHPLISMLWRYQWWVDHGYTFKNAGAPCFYNDFWMAILWPKRGGQEGSGLGITALLYWMYFLAFLITLWANSSLHKARPFDFFAWYC